ncbi:MAG: hypothetical protein NVS2B8_21170 [Vulcanimicrobiaceae bacterium]
MNRAPLVSFLTLALTCVLVAAARADQTYTVSGKDTFAVGADDIRSEVTYNGLQRLSVTRRGALQRMQAHVAYTRSDGSAQNEATADYTADVTAAGETTDSADHDPDYLTVLNQPFSAVLDRGTLADLQHLHGALPFDFPSPFTGSSLHGYLQHIGNARVGPSHSIGVRFESAGPMKGELPDRPGITLVGTIAMRGTAYYDRRTALLLALETTVTITGTVSNRAGKDPVTITYARSIHASPHAASTAGKAL